MHFKCFEQPAMRQKFVEWLKAFIVMLILLALALITLPYWGGWVWWKD